MIRPQDHEELTRLISRMLDEELSMLEVVRLRQLLEDDPGARRLYMQYIDAEVELSCLVPSEMEPKKLVPLTQILRKPKTPLPWPRYALAAAAALLFSAVFALVVVQFMGDDPAYELSMTEFRGKVLIQGPDGPRPPGLEALKQGESVHTRDAESTAVLAYPDGTRLKLWGNSSLKGLGGEGKAVELLAGSIGAEISAQDIPMRFETGLARTEVLGTRLAMSHTDQRTTLRVFEGEVRITRKEDEKSVEVPANHYAVVLKDSNGIESKPFPRPPDKWEINFEKQGAVKGSVGNWDKKYRGLRAVVEKTIDGEALSIAPPPAWPVGMFAIHDDTHLNLAYKQDRPEFFHLFMTTEIYDPDKPPAGLYNYSNNALWLNKKEIGKWRTVSIPLRDFKRVSDKSGVSPVGDIPMHFAFSSVNYDPGLVVRRLWASRGAPKECVTLKLEK